MRRSATIDRVLKGQLCSGCGLCAAVSAGAIEMETVAPGYSRPRQRRELTARAEEVIDASCPGVVVEPWGRAGNVHPYWGPWRSISTGHAVDEEVRYEGSSGGALSALLIHALDVGIVDRVIHVKADPLQPTRNLLACSRNAAEVLEGAGSRYTASSPLSQIEEILAEGGALAFVGKPCDVSALRRLGRKDPRVARHVPIALSFFCGGMPSHNGVERILSSMGVRLPDVAAFRYRGKGWPGTAAATIKDGGVVRMSYAESWGEHLSKEVQFRCKICPDAVGGVADIACADAWYGGESGYPTFEEQDGRSLLVVRTEAGQQLLQSALRAGALAAEQLAIAEIDAMQPSQARRKRLIAARAAALVATLQPRPDMSGTRVLEAARRGSALDAAKNFLGTARRIVLGRR